MIKAVIFDLNGIFIQAPLLSDRFKEDYGIEIEDFLPKLKEIMNKTRQPNAGGSFQYWEPVLREWNISMTEEEFWDYWFSAETVSEEMVNFAKELKTKGIKVFVLSNNFKERAEYYGHYPWIHEVIDKAYFSYQTNFVKPDPKAWELVLEENNIAPRDCLYFDDQEKNVIAARDVGIKAYMFTDNQSLQDQINSHLK